MRAFTSVAIFVLLFAVVIRDQRVAADRANYGKNYPTIIIKHNDGSFRVRPPPQTVTSDDNPYEGTETEDFVARCIGYEPSPIGDNPDRKPHLDYYTTYYRFLWETDIKVMRSLGANCIRVWSWQTLTPQDHIPFLDELYNNGMYLLLPFQMGVGGQDFDDLKSDDTRQRVRDTFRFFVRTLVSHPAVLSIMIGNEPVQSGIYAGQLPEYMSLVNEMQEILSDETNRLYSEHPAIRDALCTPNDQVKGCGHLVTVPFANTEFKEAVDTFYDSIELDFWSVQPYFGNEALDDLFFWFANFTEQPQTRSGAVGEPRAQKKMWLTERGRSAGTLGRGEVLEVNQAQADFFSDSWRTVMDNNGGGMVIMSFADQWWKGRQATLQVEGCPDYDDTKHSACGFFAQEDPPLIHLEEWFGLFEQVPSDPEFYPFLLAKDLEIVARPAATAVRDAWCQFLPLNDQSRCTMNIGRVTRKWDTVDRYPLYVLCAGVALILVIASLIACCYACVRKCRSKREHVKFETYKRWASTIGLSKEETPTNVTAISAEEFEPVNVDDEHSAPLHWRKSRSQGTKYAIDARAVSTLVCRLWPTVATPQQKHDVEKACGHAALATLTAMGWHTSDTRGHQSSKDGMKAQSILRALFAQYDGGRDAGDLCVAIWRAYWQTFHHCARHPSMEKHLIECHETPRLPRNHMEEAIDIAIQQLHQLLIERFFRMQAGAAARASDFYLGLLGPVMGSILRHRHKHKKEAGEADRDVDVTLREASQIANDWIKFVYTTLATQRVALEDFNAIPRQKLRQAPKPGKILEPTFHQRGSWLSVFVNLSFFLRFHLWVTLYAMNEQTIVGTDGTDPYLLLALVDSAMMTFVYLCEMHLLWGGSEHKGSVLLKLVQFVGHLAAFGLLFFLRVIIEFSTEFVTTDQNGLRLKLEIEFFYLVVCIALVWFKELLRQFQLSGYGEFDIEDARRGVKQPDQATRVIIVRVILFVLTSVWIGFCLIFFSDVGNRQIVRATDAFTFYAPLVYAGIGGVAIQLLIAEPLMSLSPKILKPHLNRCYGLPAAVWIIVIGFYAFAMIEWAVPSVQFLTADRVCDTAEGTQLFACALGVACVWAAMVLIGMAAFHLIDRALGIAGSIIIGKNRGVGLVQSTNNLSSLGWGFMARPLNRVLEAGGYRSKKIVNPVQVWYTLLQHDYVTHMISEDERDHGKAFASDEVDDKKRQQRKSGEKHSDPYGHTDADNLNVDNQPTWKLLAFASHVVRRRLAYLAQSLKIMPPPIVDPTNPDTLPSASIVIPLYNETALTSEEGLLARKQKGQACDLELLVSAHLREFALLARSLRPEECKEVEKGLEKEHDKDERVAWALYKTYERRVRFHKETVQDDGLVADVVVWASLRQQTAARTLYGCDNLRRGMELVVGKEITTEKLQVVLAAQEFRNLPKHRSDFTYLQKRLTFELVYDLPVKIGPSETAESLAIVVRDAVQSLEIKKDTKSHVVVSLQEDFREVPVPGMTYFTCHRTYDSNKGSFTTRCMQRPGPMLGVESNVDRSHRLQAKAVNQDNAFNVARGEAILTLDMNQDCAMQEGLKLPTLLSHYFHHPQDAIVGTAEWCNSRDDTLVGEMLGAAEFVFTTQTQRYLAGALRMRLHYGHGDFFAASYARIAGGMSKASPGVHLSEDVFSGYEAVARNQYVKHLEWFQPEKARDVGFNATQKFHAKINQGNAMQFRSREVYFLFARMPIVARYSLMSSALSFYMLSVQFTFSTFLYAFALVLFSVSNIRFHTLGLLQGKIASAWLIQLGWLLALPLFCENVMQFGIYTGFIMFWKTIIPSLFFFSATLLTNSYHFTTSVSTTAAAYLPTGRGFELDAGMTLKSAIGAFGLSHFWPAARYVFVMIWFGATTPELPVSVFFRILPILLISMGAMMSWFWFSAVPTVSSVLSQFKEAVSWTFGHAQSATVDVNKTDVKSVLRAVEKPDEAVSFSGFRTRVAMDRFGMEERSLAAPVYLFFHFLEEIFTEMFFVATLLSSIQLSTLPAAVMMALVVLTILLSRYVAYRLRIIHLVSPFDLLLITVVIITVALYFSYYAANVGGVLVSLGTLAYFCIRVLPMLLAWLIRCWYSLFSTCCCCFGCCCFQRCCGCADGRTEEYQLHWRLRAAKLQAFAESGVAICVVVILFFGCLVSAVASSLLMSLMYNAGFTRRVESHRATDEDFDLDATDNTLTHAAPRYRSNSPQALTPREGGVTPVYRTPQRTGHTPRYGTTGGLSPRAGDSPVASSTPRPSARSIVSPASRPGVRRPLSNDEAGVVPPADSHQHQTVDNGPSPVTSDASTPLPPPQRDDGQPDLDHVQPAQQHHQNETHAAGQPQWVQHMPPDAPPRPPHAQPY